MAVNLIRNSRVFFSTNVNATTGALNPSTTACTNSNTFEIQILDGFSFTQNTTSETITLNEAGATPIRGQRAFNTALEPVDFSFSTYIRPRRSTTGGSAAHTAEECVLWNAFSSGTAIGSVGAGWAEDSVAGSVNWDDSDRHQLQKFAMIMVIDNDTYIIDNCVLDQASIDFGIDAIATIAWSGKGSGIRRVGKTTLTDGVDDVTFDNANNSFDGVAKKKVTTANYLANKLSSVTLRPGIANTSATAYTVPITGGNITISNNVTYLTPANLGVVNNPITYFTGARSVSGNLTAYLKTGTNGTADLLEDLLDAASTTTEPKYSLTVHLGGSSSANLRVDLIMKGTVLQIPTINSEQVISTTINFTAQGYNSGADTVFGDGNDVFDVEATNELEVKYYAPQT